MISGIDGFITNTVALLERTSRFAMPSAGWGFAYDWKKTAFTDLMAQVQTLVDRWTKKLGDYDAKITAYDALPAGTSNDARFRALRAAEIDISVALAHLPATPAAVVIRA